MRHKNTPNRSKHEMPIVNATPFDFNAKTKTAKKKTTRKIE